MKKVFFLLFAVLCLVSCRTAGVEDSIELETVVPVVEGSSGSDSIESPELVESDSASQVSTSDSQFSQLDVENEITDNLKDSSINSSLENSNDPVIEESSSEASGEDVVIEPSLENVPAQQNDLDSSGNQDPSLDNVDSIEEASNETTLEGVDEVSVLEIPLAGTEKTIDEPVESPVVAETTGTESLAAQPDEQENVPAAPVAKPSVNAEPNAEDGSFLDRLTSFILREKLFCFGVLTVFIGIVMLIVVMIRDLVRAGRRSSKSYRTAVQDEDDETKASSVATESHDYNEGRKESSALDDDDEFLRSLLNS